MNILAAIALSLAHLTSNLKLSLLVNVQSIRYTVGTQAISENYGTIFA